MLSLNELRTETQIALYKRHSVDNPFLDLSAKSALSLTEGLERLLSQ